MKQMLLSLVSLAMGVGTALFRGLVIHMYWGWFVLTQFKNLPPLSIMGAIGLSFVVAILTPPATITSPEWEQAKKQSSDDRLTMGMLNTTLQMVAYSFALLSGYIWHLFM